jgi:hypothetical protein
MPIGLHFNPGPVTGHSASSDEKSPHPTPILSMHMAVARHMAIIPELLLSGQQCAQGEGIGVIAASAKGVVHAR